MYNAYTKQETSNFSANFSHLHTNHLDSHTCFVLKSASIMYTAATSATLHRTLYVTVQPDFTYSPFPMKMTGTFHLKCCMKTCTSKFESIKKERQEPDFEILVRWGYISTPMYWQCLIQSYDICYTPLGPVNLLYSVTRKASSKWLTNKVYCSVLYFQLFNQSKRAHRAFVCN